MATKKDKHSETGRAIAKAILEQYKPTNQEEMHIPPVLYTLTVSN